MSTNSKATHLYSLAGCSVSVLAVLLGYWIRGGEVTHDARMKQLTSISQSLQVIAENLPPKQIVEVEKLVERPARYSVIVEQELKKRKTHLNTDALGFCKNLMYGRDNSNVSVPNLYEAISEWGTTPQANNGLEDRIMAHIMLVLIECFQNT